MHYHLKNLEVPAYIGVYDFEKEGPQHLQINIYFDFAAQIAAQTDNLEDTIDYAKIEKLIRQVCLGQHFQLLETLQARLVSEITMAFAEIKNLKVSLEKFPFESGSIVVV